MRKLVVLALSLVVFIPTQAQATTKAYEFTKIVDAYVEETLPDGTAGDTFFSLNIQKPSTIGNDYFYFIWHGTGGAIDNWYIDVDGDVVARSDTIHYGQRRLESARVTMYRSGINLWGDSEEEPIASGLTMHVRWEGYGDISRDITYGNSIIHGDYKEVLDSRNATMTGWFTIGDMELPGSDFSLGIGLLTRDRYYEI